MMVEVDSVWVTAPVVAAVTTSSRAQTWAATALTSRLISCPLLAMASLIHATLTTPLVLFDEVRTIWRT